MIVLPWPSSALSPNARGHWAFKAKAVKAARNVAYYSTLEAGNKGVAVPPVVVVTFCPPDNRARDLDNMIASFKAYQDGVAQAIGVDDSQWRVAYQRGPVKRGGEVTVDVGGLAEVPFRGVIS